MGIPTVAVYSDADARRAACRDGGRGGAHRRGPPADSYLVAERILDAARERGAEAVHPGFGFLSENAGFAEALDAAGIVFIGPPPAAIAAMGDKIESKKLAQKAGVSTVPGHPRRHRRRRRGGDDRRRHRLSGHAQGVGRRRRQGHARRRNEDERARASSWRATRPSPASATTASSSRSSSSEPRHIEIQVLADTHGNVVYLGERECSIQRRHQKVIEEAPSPFLDAETREAMGEQAVALAKAVDYRSAGTVEFIVDEDAISISSR